MSGSLGAASLWRRGHTSQWTVTWHTTTSPSPQLTTLLQLDAAAVGNRATALRLWWPLLSTRRPRAQSQRLRRLCRLPAIMHRLPGLRLAYQAPLPRRHCRL